MMWSLTPETNLTNGHMSFVAGTPDAPPLMLGVLGARIVMRIDQALLPKLG